jgi:hypothetical protein
MSTGEGEELRVIGTGLTVYDDPNSVEGPTIWLDSPDAVLDFVDSYEVEDYIVIARGGTTTFLTPALVAGIKGVITLQAAPESHLGIVSREFGIPALMSVKFAEGIRSPRGEIIPPDGSVLRIDISTHPRGRVLVAGDVTLGAEHGTLAEDEEESEAEAPSPAAEELRAHLERFRGDVVGTHEGNRIMRGRQRTGILDLTDDSLSRDLTRVEINDLLDYSAWNLWDVLSARATEGESGLIPRQEYEVLYVYIGWVLHPRFHRLITEKVGVDGLRDIGAIARKEIGTKINPLHIWAAGTSHYNGRGIALDLGLEEPDDRVEDLGTMMQFVRRLYRGMWDDQGPMYTSTREYTAAILEPEWITRFCDERTDISEPEQRSLFHKFNAGTGLLSFLLHFDSRCGVADQGPYTVPGDQWVFVRDQVLNEPVYPWSDKCEGLPYAVTLAVFSTEDPAMERRFVDIGTLFTRPANYLQHVVGYAAYARDTLDTPISELRLLDENEIAEITERADTAAKDMYPTIASMTDREKILAGVHVYHTDFLGPVARAAGVWDTMVNELGYYDIDAAVDAVYDPIVTQGRAPEMLLRHWISVAGFIHVSED